MKFLVTGGAGFIGSHFCEYILNKYPDSKVVCYDKLTYAGSLQNLNNIKENKNFTFIKGDICDYIATERVIKEHNLNIIINFAAESHVDRAIESSAEFIQTNYVGVSVLLDLAKKYNMRFHQVSTDEVYGDLPLDSTQTFTEESILKPSSAYSASKAAADLLVLSYVRTFNLKATISRCTNNFGSKQHLEKLLPKTITLATKNSPIPIYGAGENVRDWLFVGEHCRAIDLIVQNGKIGEIYNVGANNELSNLTLVKRVLDIMNKPHFLITLVEDRKGHDRKYSLCCDKIKKELGFVAKNNFETNLKNTINYYVNNAK